MVLTKNGSPYNKPDDVIDLRVETSIGMTSRCDVRIRYELDTFPYRVTDKLTVKVAGTVVFAGEVISVGAELTEQGAEFTLIAYDTSYKLARSTNQRTFLKVNYGDVIQKLVSGTGLST